MMPFSKEDVTSRCRVLWTTHAGRARVPRPLHRSGQGGHSLRDTSPLPQAELAYLDEQEAHAAAAAEEAQRIEQEEAEAEVTQL